MIMMLLRWISCVAVCSCGFVIRRFGGDGFAQRFIEYQRSAAVLVLHCVDSACGQQFSVLQCLVWQVPTMTMEKLGLLTSHRFFIVGLTLFIVSAQL